MNAESDRGGEPFFFQDDRSGDEIAVCTNGYSVELEVDDLQRFGFDPENAIELGETIIALARGLLGEEGDAGSTKAPRLPPRDEAAERALLGAMINSAAVTRQILGIISPERPGWFWLPDHGKIFEVLVHLARHSAPDWGLTSVANALWLRGLLEFVGGETYLQWLAELRTEPAEIEGCAERVRKYGRLRDLIVLAGQIGASAYAPLGDPDALISEARRRLAELANAAEERG